MEHLLDDMYDHFDVHMIEFLYKNMYNLKKLNK